jgi:hypothetical protein
VKDLMTLVVLLGVAISLSVAAHAEGDTTESQAKAPECKEAVVNPVTGYTFCINPRGAPVEPPARSALQRPCKPRAHDADPFTVYEHWSGCSD